MRFQDQFPGFPGLLRTLVIAEIKQNKRIAPFAQVIWSIYQKYNCTAVQLLNKIPKKTIIYWKRERNSQPNLLT